MNWSTNVLECWRHYKRCLSEGQASRPTQPFQAVRRAFAEFNVLILSGSVATESEDCISCVLSLSEVWLWWRRWACPGRVYRTLSLGPCCLPLEWESRALISTPAAGQRRQTVTPEAQSQRPTQSCTRERSMVYFLRQTFGSEVERTRCVLMRAVGSVTDSDPADPAAGGMCCSQPFTVRRGKLL
ncbi:hypothetical protein COCON_G00157470 [Conger conger]|uniref:Uncharacterized protein n=1 Tax=Conger conger TaxID=82655 RepID=A0A9Q1HUZ6_CONCO|nr:hypothetical protein COCON_G00157470 [Conger conger]